uniref:Uncharacterized protein n=1 Tax=Cucumis melo TaxID=3656 RepID=A0A9I9ELE5_CUCME
MKDKKVWIWILRPFRDHFPIEIGNRRENLRTLNLDRSSMELGKICRSDFGQVKATKTPKRTSLYLRCLELIATLRGRLSCAQRSCDKEIVVSTPDRSLPTLLEVKENDVGWLHAAVLELLRRDFRMGYDMKKVFNGAQELECAQEPLSGEKTFVQRSKYEHSYEYWKYLDVQHCLDMMHIEKNCPRQLDSVGCGYYVQK